ncbi:UPF0311 protein [Amycolatopsis sp. NBRC 101858]|uniref:DUF3237 family protein n=1 Tax=Amycolatopsis sp. NBRC 101858 TaxID=3032200 RepID=UPI00249FC14E|nr:DUF3237 family protein [Amycolatopsis sp. NBRC 101858]GLY43178.1 UPF0311 protein [Amycolatopsis sp. NBRC 101858]
MTHPELAMDLVARLEVRISEPIDAGMTPAGHRRVIPITGGTVTGPRITGEVLGIGADWSVVRGDGVAVVTAQYLIRTDDGVVLTVTNTGAFTAQGIVTTPRIEAPEGPYSWLNDAVLVGTLVPRLEDARPLGVSLEFHQVRVK